MRYFLLKYFWLFLIGLSILNAQAQNNECNFSKKGPETNINDVKISSGILPGVCANDDYQTLPDIVISETTEGYRAMNGDDAGSLVLVLELPTGLEFKRTANVVTVTTSGSIKKESISVQSNGIFIFLSSASASNDPVDAITISGLEIRNINAAPGDHIITVSTSVGCVNGIAGDGSTQAGKLTLLANTSNPTFSFNQGPQFCKGDNIPNGFLVVNTANSTDVLKYYSGEALDTEITPIADRTNPTASELNFSSSNAGKQGVYVLAESSSGCRSGAVKIEIEIFEDPVLDVSTLGGEVCPGDRIEIDLGNYANGSISWINSNTSIGLAASGSDLISFTAAQNDTGADIAAKVTVTSVLNGCDVTAEINFSLKTGPKIGPFSPVVEVCNTSGDIDLSKDSRFALSVSNGGVITEDLFSYSGKGITHSSGIFNASGESWSDNELVDIDVTFTRADGCATTRKLTLIKIISNPTVSISSPLTGADLCRLKPVELIVENNNQTSGLSWSSSGNGSFSGTFNSSSLTNTFYYTPGTADLGPVTLTVVSNDPGAPCSVDSDQLTINFYEPMVAPLSDIYLCPAEALSSIEFTSSRMPGEGTFSWSVGDKDLLGLSSSTGTGSLSGIVAAANTTGSNLSTTVTVIQTVNGCSSAPMKFKVIVKPQPVVNDLTNKTVCSGEPVTVNFSSLPLDEGTTFEWTSSNTAIGLAASGTGDLNFVAGENQTSGVISSTIIYTAKLNDCISAQKSFTININPTPEVNKPAPVEVCSGGLVNRSFTSTVAGASFSWSIADAVLGMPASGSGDLNFTSQIHHGSTDVVREVKVRASKDGCTGADSTFYIILKPLPRINAQADTVILPGQSVGSIHFGDNSGEKSTYSWSATNAAAIGLPSSGTGALPVFTANGNTTGASIISTVTVSALWNGCSSAAPLEFNIELKPQPVMVAVEDEVACPASLVEVVFSSDVAGSTFSWTNNKTGIGLAASGIGNISFTAADNFSTVDSVATIKVKPVSPEGIEGNAVNFNITIKPVPVIDAQTDIKLCPGESGADINFTSSSMPGEGTFSWSVGDKDLLGLSSSTGTGSLSGIVAAANTTGSNLSTTVTVIQTVNGCSSAPMKFKVIVKPQPVATSINNQAFCPGEAVSIEFSANTNESETTFSWTSSNTAIGTVSSGTGNLVFTAAENTGTADISSTITYTAATDGCQSVEKSFVVSIKPKPVLDQPANLEICTGTLARREFSASLTGSSFSWTIDDPILGMPASGTGNLNFDTEPHLGSENVVRTVKVRASKNGCVGEEKQFTLTLTPAPQFVQQTNLEIFPGENVPELIFKDNSGGGSIISWTASNANLLGLATNSGSSSIPAFTANENLSGATIISTVIVDALWNGCNASSMEFTISLRPRPVMTAEEDVVACPDELLEIAFQSNVPGSTYKWTNSNTAIGLTSASGTGNLSFTAAGNSSGVAIQSSIKVTPVSPDNFEGKPIEFKIILNPVPVTGDVEDIAICPGEKVSVTFVDNTEGETFFWANDKANIGLGANGEGGFEFTGADNFSGKNDTATINYYALREGCKSVVKTFKITLKNQPVAVQMEPSAICSGVSFTPAVFSDDTGGASEFFWTIDKPALLGLTEASGSGNLPVFQPADNLSGEAIIATIEYYSTLNGCVGNTLTYKITLLPKPILVNEDITACANEALSISLMANTGGGETYSWTNSNAAIGLSATTGSGGLIRFTTKNTTDVEQFTTITVKVSKDGCSFAGQAFKIFVKPLPKITNPTSELLQNLCSGSAVVFNPVSNLDEVSYRWTASSDKALIDFKTSGEGPINEIPLNKNNSTATVKYTIRPVRADGVECTGAAVELVVRIAPVPDLVLPQLEYSVCIGEELSISPASTTTISGTTYEWKVSSNISGGNSGSGGKIVQTLGNEYNKADTIIYTINSLAGGCRSALQTVMVYVRPYVTVNAGDDITVCEEESIVLQGKLGGSAAFGTWSGGLGTFQNPISSITTYHPDPSEIGTSFKLFFTTNDPSGPCSAKSDTVIITIEPLPEVAIINLPAVFCTLNEPFLLEGYPAHGIFSGEGVVYNEEKQNYYFDPKISGIGYRVTYSYKSSNGCTGISEGVIEVTSGSNPDFNILSSNETICDTQSRIALSPQVQGGIFEGPGVEIAGGSAWFNPGHANIGDNEISYTIIDPKSGCTTFSRQTIFVNARPELSIEYGNLCQTNSVQFQAPIGYISENDTILSYQWSFGDGFSSTEKAPVRQYGSPGLYNVTLRVKTALTCEVTEVKQDVVVSNITSLDFAFENICGNDTTLFRPKSIEALLNYSNSSYVWLEYAWDFGDPQSGAANTSNLSQASHKFSTFGEYEVRLTIRSNLGCEETVSQKINIVPAITSFPHLQQFEGSAASNGWFTEGTNSSWQYGIPSGEVINHPAVDGTNVWGTGATDGSGYHNNERSYVISPCFDLKSIEQPMISMNLFLHAETGRDGAVLQYSKDGGRSWATLGSLNQGLNWYNTSNIVADPAEQGIGNLGWSGIEEDWKEVAFSLDALSQEANSVIFRLSFAADASNVGELHFEGIALDDVYVGPRNKKVLVENFTNTNATGFLENAQNFMAIMDNQNLANDVVLLQYHTPFPLPDSVNLRNKLDPGARALFYGIYQAPGIVIDGQQSENIDLTTIGRQSLSKPNAFMGIQIDNGSGSSQLKGIVEVSPVGVLDKELILYINAVEVEAGSGSLIFRNVLKKILPESSGIYLNGLPTAQAFNFEWDVSKDFDAGNLGVVAYLQEKSSKKVLQSHFMPIERPMKAGYLTALGDVNMALKKINVYPNPADKFIQLRTNSPFAREMEYEIIQLNGSVVAKGILKAGEKEYEILSTDLVNGMYFLRVFTSQSEPATFKIMVLHHK